jgi:hypothetical protein
MIEFVEYTEDSRKAYAKWLASLTKSELLEYAEIKMMPSDYMLEQWKTARKMQRGIPQRSEV